jgi:hypothetical protein
MHIYVPHSSITSILDEFYMPKCNFASRTLLETVKFDKDDGREGVCSTFYHYIIGKFIYFINIQPNFTHVIGICKLWYMRMLKRSHLETYISHHIFRYLKSTKNYMKYFTILVMKITFLALLMYLGKR